MYKRRKKVQTLPNAATKNAENIMKKQLLGLWEGLKSEKVFQMLDGIPLKML